MAKKAIKPHENLLGYRYHSPNVPLSAIRRYAKKIASKFDPDRIILFGSYAYGQPHEWSDVDLLVVMRAHDETNQAIRIINSLEAPFSLDLIVRTPEKIERDWRDGDWFLREVLAKGKVIHEKTDRPLGPQGRGRPGRRKKPGAGQTLTE
jgi:predicted nucleotidyltransferase